MVAPSPAPLTGRVAFVTGANTGIGFVTARELARRGASVWIACRSTERAAAAVQRIRESTGAEVSALALDLGDLDSVRRCARDFLATGLPLHMLINNAGLGGKRGLTASGFEMAFGVNHVGHFLLTQLLLERIRRSAPARIVTVASNAHYEVRGLDLDSVRRPTSWPGVREYQASKLANVLFSAELGRLLAGSGVTTYSLHPGVIDTDVWREVPRILRPLLRLRRMRTPDEGAQTTLHCATSPAVGADTSLYYHDCAPRAPNPAAEDPLLAQALWRRSLEWVG